MGSKMCMLTAPRLLKWGLVLPLVLLPLSLLEHRHWWQHLVLLVGSYVVVVLGTVAGWKLTDLAEKAGGGVRLVVRACVGMTMSCAILGLGWIVIPPTARKIPHFLDFLADWKILLILVSFGVFYALPPSRWGKQRGGATKGS